MVADFGTATTFDCVAADGAFVGGAIAPGLELGPRGARGADRQAAPGRAANARPGDRPRHGRRDPVGTILGYQALVDGLIGRIRAELAEAAGAPRRRSRDPDRRPVGGAVGPVDRGRRRDRPRPDPQGPRHPPRRGRRRQPLELGLPDDGDAAGSTGRLVADRGRHRLDRRLQGRRAGPSPPRRGRRRRRPDDPVATRFVGAADLRRPDPSPGRDDVPGSCPTGGSATSWSPTAPMRSSSRRPPPTGSAAMATGLAGDAVTAPASRRPRRSSSPRRWTARCTPTRRPGRMWPACATSSATRSSSPRRDRSHGPDRRGAAGRARRDRRGRRRRRSATGRSAPPIPPRARPRRGRPRRRSRRRHLVVTAGGTAEPIDPVRSSAIARPARWASPSPRPPSIAARGSP